MTVVANNQDYVSIPPTQLLSYGSCDEITPQADLEGSLSSLGQIEVIDDIVLDSDPERFSPILLPPNTFQRITISILDNESEYTV